MIWIVSFLQHSRLELYFPDIGQTGGIFPLSVQKQFYVWASRGEAVENWYSYAAPMCEQQLSHTCTIHETREKTQTNTLHVCDVLFKVCCLMLDSFVEVSGGGGGNSWLRLKGKHSTTDNLNNGQTNLILIRLSSVSTTCFTWQTCSRTSLCTTKAQHRLLSIIPKHWHDCTPLYSRPNYPGPL